MEAQSDFYVTLPSNVSPDLFPRNINGHYKTRLERELHLKRGEWEVGLAEFHYTKSFYNIRTGGIVYYSQDIPASSASADFLIGPVNGVFQRRVVAIPPGHYRTLQALASALTTSIQGTPLQGALTLRIDFNKVVTMTLDLPEGQRQRVRRVQLYGDLPQALGIPPSTVLESPSMIQGKLVADIDRGMTALFVYADIVDKHLVGDSYVQLLRVVSLSKNDIPYENVGVEFSNIQYHEVGNFRGREVEVRVARDDGQTVEFNSGKVMLVLHFRKTRKAIAQGL